MNAEVGGSSPLGHPNFSMSAPSSTKATTQDIAAGLQIRRFESGKNDSLIPQLTEILHSSYRPLAEQGMRYLASHQAPETTLRRLSDGESYLAFLGDELVGTISLRPPRSESRCGWYRSPGVFSFGQFALAPSSQNKGLGSRLLDFVESRAKALGAVELALDTAEQADKLIAMYAKRNYRFIEYVRWDETNYRSVIMSKALPSGCR